jgi:hypothetical protein
MRQWQVAEQHFEEALEMNNRMGARPWLAHTQYEYAQMLQARSSAGDIERARKLLEEAAAIARQLSMRSLESRIATARRPFPVPP